MNTKDFISIQQFCQHYNVSQTFIDALRDYELIEITTTENTQFVSIHQIKNIEKLIRFHYELDINIEGIHAILNLLNQVEDLQDQIKNLNNKLNFYENM